MIFRPIFIKLYPKALNDKKATFDEKGIVFNTDHSTKITSVKKNISEEELQENAKYERKWNNLDLLISRIEILLTKWMTQDLIEMSNKLKELWKEHMESNFKDLDLPACFSEDCESKTKRLLLNQYYLRISLSFESLFLIPFSKQFNYLLETVEFVQKLSKMINVGNQLLMHSLKVCSNSEIILLVLLISSTLTNSKEFWETLSTNEKKNWKFLETTVLTMCDNNQELLVLYNELKGALSKKSVPQLIIPNSE